jgi:hypothetical protein
MKRTLTLSSVLLLLVLALVLLNAGFGSDVTTDPEISTIISQVDSNRILDTATALQNFGTRQSCSTQLASSGQGVTPARDFLFNQYSAIPGLQVRLDPFVHPRCPNLPTFKRDRVAARKNAQPPGDYRRSLRFAHHQRP